MEENLAEDSMEKDWIVPAVNRICPLRSVRRSFLTVQKIHSECCYRNPAVAVACTKVRAMEYAHH